MVVHVKAKDRQTGKVTILRYRSKKYAGSETNCYERLWPFLRNSLNIKS